MKIAQSFTFALILWFTLQIDAGPVIGIDLGTTTSCVGVMQNGKVEIIPNHHGNRVTPSMVSFSDHEILVGNDVGDKIITNPDNTVYEVKRMIGRRYISLNQPYLSTLPFKVIKGTDGKPKIEVNYDNNVHQHTPEEISSMVLSQLKQTAESYLGRTVNEAVITVPAHFDDYQRGATKDAGQAAGLNVLRIIDEPTASAIAYGLDKLHSESWILVYHLGGNTLDVTLLALDEGVFEVVATAGDKHFGGTNFDDNLLNYFIGRLKQKKYNIDITNNEHAKGKLRKELEKAKRALSSTTKVRIDIENLVDGVDFSEWLTRAQFEELNIKLFKNTLKSIEKVLKGAGWNGEDIRPIDIDEIILSGGSTQIPKIKELVREFFGGKDPNRGINPDESACYGAAVQAAILASDEDRNYMYNDVGFGEHIVLNGQNVEIDINNNYASITYSFEFENTDKNRADELQYELNIDSGAYISYFIGEIDGVVYKGITKEKKKAATEYQQAKEDKKNAILVSQDHDANTFKIQTNIQPGSKAVLNVTVEQLLVRTFGYYELSLDISNIDNNFRAKSNVIPIQINLTDSRDIGYIEIPFGTYDVVEDGINHKRIKAEIPKQSYKGLSYFILRYKSKRKENEYNELLFDPKSNTFLHKFGFDEMKQKILPRRVVFILDKSGSMWGIWKKAQEAIIGAISNLKEEIDRFGVVLFDSDVETFPSSGIEVAINKNNVKNAINYIKNTQPGSATNLYGGIEGAMKMIVEDIEKSEGDAFGYVNQIIFVTDGVANVGVTDPDKIVKNIYDVNSKLIAPISIFGIGIGEDHGNQWVDYLNYPLIRQISIQNGGFDKRIKESETKESLEKYYKILESPQLSYIDVTYESDVYDANKLTQRTFNTLYSGTDIVICGKLDDKIKGSKIFDGALNAVITANGGTKIEKKFALMDDGDNNVDIERIWAYLSLKNYENLLLQNEGKIDNTMRRLINENALNLALTFKLVTPWTSMIVVEEKQIDDIDINKDDDEWPERPQHYERYDHSGETQGILLLDVTPLSLGIESKGGYMKKVIEKNSVIPTKKNINLKGSELTQINKLENNNMDAVMIRIVQGERAKVDDNIILGEYILNGIYNASIDIEVIFEIDANGILNVQTIDDINGKMEITITADKGRPSQEEIDDMLRDAELYAEEDESLTLMVDAKNRLESSVYNLKNLLDDKEELIKLDIRLNDEDKEILKEKANDIIDWLDDNEDGQRDDYEHKQQEFDDVVKLILKDVYQHISEEDVYQQEFDDDDDDYYTDHEDL